MVVGRSEPDSPDVRAGLYGELTEGRKTVDHHAGALQGSAEARVALQNLHRLQRGFPSMLPALWERIFFSS